MQKLIKINTDHYVIVDNSEIKEGDWMIRNGEQPTLVTPNFWWDFGVPYKKITHSTQPLELLTLSENGLSGMGFSKVRPLNIFNVKELIGEVDVNKKAEQEYREYPNNPKEHPDWQYGRDTNCHRKRKAFIKGYNQALEDNKDKKYTEEDLRIALVYGYERGREGDFTSEQEEEFYKYLQPPTSWEVEIVDGKLKLK